MSIRPLSSEMQEIIYTCWISRPLKHIFTHTPTELCYCTKNRIWSVDSTWPPICTLSPPANLFFQLLSRLNFIVNHLLDKGMYLQWQFCLHDSINHLFVQPQHVNSLYKDAVEKTPDFSNTHLTISVPSDKTTLSRREESSSHSIISLVPKFLLNVKLIIPLPIKEIS
jgi:hypothetical protein